VFSIIHAKIQANDKGYIFKSFFDALGGSVEKKIAK
jgi:hypothetical protein